ncbi:MAG: biliverdin-producing heme oxygenase [Sphingomicrobium sp.]
MSAHAYLRVATRAAHDQVDSHFSGFNLSDRSGYTRFLAAQAAAFLPIERALDEAGAEALVADWQHRRRSHLLRDDLAQLGAAIANPIAAPRFDSPEALLGAIYVLEGSRLGGTMLARSVGIGFPRRFLGAAAPHGGWKGFIALLEQHLVSHVQRERAGNSAILTFDCFFQAAASSLDVR